MAGFVYGIACRMLQLTINGEARTLPSGSTLADMVGAYGVDIREVAVMKGDTIIPRSAYANTALENGDVIELVSFIGGG